MVINDDEKMMDIDNDTNMDEFIIENININNKYDNIFYKINNYMKNNYEMLIGYSIFSSFIFKIIYDLIYN